MLRRGAEMTRERGAGMELLEGVSALAEKADKDGPATRVFFAGRAARSGIIPASELLVLMLRGGKRREYERFGPEWPSEFKVVGKVMKNPRYLCSAIAGMLSGTLYVGTDEVRWSPVKPGEARVPVPLGEKSGTCGCTRHDLHEKNLRKVGALNPVRMVRHRLLLMLGKAAFDPKVAGEDELDVQDQLDFPTFYTSVTLPFTKFRLRQDAPDAVARAKHVIKTLSKGQPVTEERGCSMLLAVLRHANQGMWLGNEYAIEAAPYTGMFRLGDKAGCVLGQLEAPIGHDGETHDVEGTKCLPRIDEFTAPTNIVNDELDRLFEGEHHVRYEPTVGKDWQLVRQGQPLWLPKDTPKKAWTPEEIVAHPYYRDLQLLAALATVRVKDRLTLADIDLVVGTEAWVDLDSVPRVQLVGGAAGLCHFGNGTKCNLARLDIEAHIRENRATKRRP